MDTFTYVTYLFNAEVVSVEPVGADGEQRVDVQLLHLLGDAGAVVGVVGARQHVAAAREQRARAGQKATWN